jgi:hypothetical protein
MSYSWRPGSFPCWRLSLCGSWRCVSCCIFGAEAATRARCAYVRRFRTRVYGEHVLHDTRRNFSNKGLLALGITCLNKAEQNKKLEEEERLDVNERPPTRTIFTEDYKVSFQGVASVF